VKKLLDNELKLTNTPYEGLLDNYALLILTVGITCTQKHVHDAWSIWQNNINASHRSLIPFESLSKEVQELDEPFRLAIVKVAMDLKM
jgi:hypothetical protein